MPRQVDHESRRRLIAEAVCRLAGEGGLEGVTLRDVATRAGVSMGAVQRCFRTKEEMLLFALRYVGDRVGERVRANLVRSPAQSAATALGHAATEVALLREEHRAEARVWLAFLAQAVVAESLGRVVRAGYAELSRNFVRLVAEAAPGADPEREARALLALADGLTVHVLIGHLTSGEAQDVLHGYVAGLWERCSAGGDAR
ncbi:MULTISPECIES: TetR/AcrR family transcriptional regulator [Streptomyces]|uniref:TetR/AcrR family transcriptional regulator n=1 Tax=Streptomyces TaxID=1883 RepID=UPI0016760279|nr:MULTISPECIES: TetR/AcrR family transcriptional regulator [Streptomyces]MBD3577001.1 TetR family transcriptional regulator C-terminal domain-containing protein [Streptomyces sp. KD18]